MTDYHDPSLSDADIAVCDREPIHIPGSIQPHGLLLIADATSLKVKAGAGDLEGRFHENWLGEPLADLLRQDLSQPLTGSGLAHRLSFPLAPVVGNDQTFSAIAHCQNGELLVELEPQPHEPWSALRMLDELDRAASTFERASDLRELAEAAASAFSTLTGYDRVMVYRFLDDDAGVVIAERCAEDVGSFLNHHFPASDIPKQARELYVRNRVRVIPDTGYTPALIRPQGEATGTDLSDVSIRSVSPVHLQYLANMNVGASASMSIVKDDILWGLIACHNRSPLDISYDRRLACKKLASDLARQIRAKEDAGNYRERARLRASEDTVIGRLGGGGSLQDLFANTGNDLRKMLGADGYAAVQGNDLFVDGRCPHRDQIFAIAHHFASRALAQPFVSYNLESDYPPASDYRDRASGLIVVTMSSEEPTILMWFRAEQIEVVNWAGNPHLKVAENDSTGAPILSPRASFEAWSEKVRGHSERWTREEIEAANRLKRAMFEARQNQRMRELNRELAKSIADKENLIEQKNYLMGEANHRVQNSLQLVSAFLSLQSRETNDDRVSASLAEAQRRLSAVALVHRRLYADDRIEAVDLARYLEDLVSELMSSMDPKWGDAMRLSLSPILISTDRAVNVGLILTELLINANKYAYDGDAGPIAVTLDQHRNRIQLIVADRGRGDLQTSEGFGSRMLKAIVSKLDGELTRMSNDPGLRVVVTIPIERD